MNRRKLSAAPALAAATAPAGQAHMGQRLRLLRTGRKLTLDQLSTMAGVSKAMLSQIEQDKVNPTVAVMLKIAGALKLPIGQLVEAPRPQRILRVIAASDKAYTFRSDPHCNIRTLSPLDLEKTIEFYRVSIAPGGRLASEPHFPGAEEIVYLAKGRLTVTCADQTTALSRGDSIHYRADVPHTLHNTGRGAAELYMIVRYGPE